jgi:hypothetical protein
MRTALASLIAFLCLVTQASAHGGFVGVWQGIYPNSVTDDNVQNGTGSSCQICHWNPSGGSSWNAYGWRVHQGLDAGLTIEDAIPAAASANSDSDPVGAANLIEISAGTQPGWTPGPHNTQYTNTGQSPGLNPPAAILGSLDPGSALYVYCSPGQDGTLACPCGNAPIGTGLGCNNSDNTGGAGLGASGIPSVAADSVVFLSAGQKASATSVFLQGTAQNASGAAFGQGVRCVAGSLKRLYVRQASGGSIQVPGAGDPSISARSAALGDPLAAGLRREYMVYYRDPNVLGGCAPTATFNATNSGSLIWLP